jgi:MoaA/NifB/PqqE/SkfB family radical SAM enzyme
VNWNFNRACNFHCDYCINARNEPFFGPSFENVKEAVDRLTLKYLWSLTGGEVFLNKDIIKICEFLTEKHLIGINTNLSIPIDDFVKKVKPSGVEYILVSLHITQRNKLNIKLDQVVDQIKKLQDSGFKKIFLTQLCDEYALNVFDNLYEWFNKKGIYLIPRKIRDTSRFKMSYTEEHLSKIKYYGDLCNKDKSIFENDAVITDYPVKRKDKLCPAGSKYIIVQYNGIVMECWSGRANFGNLFSDFDENALYKDEISCPYESCSCPPPRQD